MLRTERHIVAVEFILLLTDIIGTLLMRYVDDYLLLTDEESYAHRFITTLTSGELREEYSCVIKPEKTSTNISLVTLSAADKQDIELCCKSYIMYKIYGDRDAR